MKRFFDRFRMLPDQQKKTIFLIAAAVFLFLTVFMFAFFREYFSSMLLLNGISLAVILIVNRKKAEYKKLTTPFIVLAVVLVLCGTVISAGYARSARNAIPSVKEETNPETPVSAELKSISIGIVDGQIELEKGKTYKGVISVEGGGDHIFDDIYFTCTDKTVVEFQINNDTHGNVTEYRITALSAGTAYVYAMSNGGMQSNRIRITVTDPALTTAATTEAATAEATTAAATTTAATTAPQAETTVVESTAPAIVVPAAAPAKTEAPKATDPPGTDPPAPATEAPQQAEEPAEETYILNTNTHKFHYPWCSSVSQMKAKNRKEVTDTRDNLINRGYSPCQRCNP